MWSSMFSPDRPKVTKRVDARRIVAFFRPYLVQQALVLVCIFVVSLLGLLPPLFTKWLIDGAIPARDMHGVWLDVGRHGGDRDPVGPVGRVSGLSQLARRRRHHARHPHEPRRTSAQDAALVFHGNQNGRDHEPRLERRRQHRQRRHRHARDHRDQRIHDDHDGGRSCSSWTGGSRWSRSRSSR